MGYATLDEMFKKLPERFNSAKAKGDKATLAFEMSGNDNGAYWMKVNEGTLETGQGAAPSEPDLIIKAAGEDFLKIMNGEMNPMTAFMSGKVKAERNMGLAMKLMGWFGM